MFDFTPVGAGLAIGGVIFLAFGWRLLPADRKGAASMNEAFNLEGYTTEVDDPRRFAAGRQDRRRGGEAVRGRGRGADADARARPHPRAAAGHQTARRPHADPDGPAGRAEAAGGRSQAQARARREHRRDRRARRRYRRHGSDRHRGLAAGRPLGHAIPAPRASPGEPACGQPQRPPHRCTGSARRGSSPATSSCCKAISTPCRRRSANCAACRWRSAACSSAAAAAACCRWRCWRSRCC